MAIRIPKAYTPEGSLVSAKDVDPDDRCEHYTCPKCEAKLTFTKAHEKQAGEDVVRVPAFFKLWPKRVHTRACPFNLKERIKVIARDSEEAGEFLAREPKASKYRFRLMVLPNSEREEVAEEITSLPAKPRHAKDPEYCLSENKLPAYLSTARRILELRVLCENNDGMEEILEFIYAGKTIHWSDVCFEHSDYPMALAALVDAGTPYPMALIGEVRKLFIEEKDGKKTYCLNMMPFRSRRSPDGIVTCVEPRIKTSHEFFFKEIATGDLVVAFGHWNPWPGTDSVDGATTFKHDYLYLRPRRKDQIAKEPEAVG